MMTAQISNYGSKTSEIFQFKKLTPESIKAIDNRIYNEITRIEIEKTYAEYEGFDEQQQTPQQQQQPQNLKSDTVRKDGQINKKNELKVKKVPEKDYEAGQKLSLKYKKLFPKKLFGTPIEEIDDFYKTEYVINSVHLFFL